jgi:hypothetical protein
LKMQRKGLLGLDAHLLQSVSAEPVRFYECGELNGDR